MSNEKLTKETFLEKLTSIYNGAKEHFKLEAMAEGEGAEDEAATEDEPTIYPTKDGQMLILDGELAEGTMVMVQTAEGDEVAPDGSYELETGEVLSVVEGAITAVEPSPLGEDETAEEMPADFEAKFSALEDSFSNKVKDALKAQRIELEQSFNKKLEGIGSAFEKATNLMVEFADTPITGEEPRRDGRVNTVGKPGSPIAMLGKNKKEN